ncbi:MAG: SDR family oxidoreductase [Solirubrobacteraceae bacterium]
MRFLLSGASGFVGRAAAVELQRRGHEVAALVRRPGSAPPGASEIAGELGDGPGLAAALVAAAPDCVIHLAAEIASQRDAVKVQEVNVEGTRRLVEGCLQAASPPRFVFASTVVTGEADGVLLDEQTELPVQTAYGRSKQAGEAIVRGSGLDTVILRPSHVYGPGGWFEQEFVARLRQPGRFAVIGSGSNLWDVVRVEDVASAIADAAERAPAGSLYHVADDEAVTFYDFVARAAAALGVGAPRRIPRALASLIAGRDAVIAVTRSARSSNALIKRELGWCPQYASSREGVPDAVRRLQAERAR